MQPLDEWSGTIVASWLNDAHPHTWRVAHIHLRRRPDGLWSVEHTGHGQQRTVNYTSEADARRVVAALIAADTEHAWTEEPDRK